MGVGLSSSPPWLLLASWGSLSWSLKRDTLREMATGVVTEMICSGRYLFTTPSSPLVLRQFPPTALAASWSMKLLPLPRGAQSFLPLKWQVCGSVLRGHMFGTSVLLTLARLGGRGN